VFWISLPWSLFLMDRMAFTDVFTSWNIQLARFIISIFACTAFVLGASPSFSSCAQFAICLYVVQRLCEDSLSLRKCVLVHWSTESDAMAAVIITSYVCGWLQYMVYRLSKFARKMCFWLWYYVHVWYCWSSTQRTWNITWVLCVSAV